MFATMFQRWIPIAVAALLPVWLDAASIGDEFLPRLTAVTLSSDQVHPGDTLYSRFEFVNDGTAPSDADYTVFVHVRPAIAGDPDVQPGTGADFRPLTPTFVWLPGAVVSHESHPILIPKTMPPGRYNVLVGFFEPGAGERHKLANDDLAVAGQRYRIASFEVLADDVPLKGKPVEARWRDTAGCTPVDLELAKLPVAATTEIASGELKIVLSASQPRVHRFELPDGRRMTGDASGYPLRARICRTSDDRYRTVCLRDAACCSVQRKDGEVRYSIRVHDEGKPAAVFDVVFRVDGNVLRVRIENVKEEPGFLLMDVWLPQLVSARTPNGELVLPTQSGRLVHLNRSAPGLHTIGMNWFEMDLCGAVIDNGCAASIRTRDWDNELEARVSGAGGQLVGGYAVRLALRAEARGKAAKIQLARTPGVEVAVLGASQGQTPVGWIDAAKSLRREVKGSANPLYRDAYIYKIFCDSPGSRDFTTFDDAVHLIRKIHELAPWLKQIVYLVGWQYEGHDTGYPATDRFNQRLGGLDGLRRAAEAAAKYNAVLSYHDNFDDAYRTSPQWDENFIARNAEGGLQLGGVWAGGQSYILAFNKYSQKAGVERVRRTVSQMPVRDSYHIDVLSAVPMRRDYHPQFPESTSDSLAGKCAIVREFNRLGVDVTSEGFTAPFVGVIGHSWHLWRNEDPLFAGDEPIPFIPMIYHGGPTTYGRGNPNAEYASDSALYGASYSTDLSKNVDVHEIAEPIYLVVAPWTCLRERKIEGFQRQGDVSRVTYAEDTFVEVNRATRQCKVVVDGATLLEDGLVVVRKADLLAIYAQTARRAQVELPLPLRDMPLVITNACTGEDITARSQSAGGAVTIDLPAREPVVIRAPRKQE